MADRYVLKNKMWDDMKMNRLTKKIKDNAESDRKEAEDLLSSCKEAMGDLTSLLQIVSYGEEGSSTQSADTLHKLISAAATALGQMGNANEKLLKLATLLQKYRLKEMDSAKGGTNELKGSMFTALSQLADKKDDER
tara:strand:+ start:107710 stop:108120 length:411 start_codon:yes stop_codon:yes gene_type:complete